MPDTTANCHEKILSHPSTSEQALGGMAALVDKVADTYVFGPRGAEGLPRGSAGRPRGMITIDTIDDMDKLNELKDGPRLRWHQFLQVWLDVGWTRVDLIHTVHELRPLLCGPLRSTRDMTTVDSEEMATHISTYFKGHGSRLSVSSRDLLDFLHVVHSNFSSPDAVLVPNETIVDLLKSK